MKLRMFISIPVQHTAGLDPLLRDLGGISGVRTSPMTQLHITLRFLGDVDEERLDDIEKIVRDSLIGIHRSRLTIKGVGAFPNERNPRIIWAGIETEIPLTQIAESLSKKLKAKGIPFDEKEFKPHITVARVEGRPNLTHMMSKYRTTEFESFIPPAVMVMKSELFPTGARHTIVRYCEFS